ncbi:MAG: hypothetical protein DMG69_33275, partial [Acidobacteria bacterium]
SVRAETHSYQVIGVAQAIGTAFGRSQDNFMMIPLSAYRKGWHRQSDWVTVFVQAPYAEMMPATEDEARMLMRAWRHLALNAPDNFAILGSDSVMSLWHQLMGNIEFMAMALVSVFLVVGGIVIMNIMLASVTERTREIGIRRSLGARKNHILLQFMAESAVLAAAGGLIGIGLAYGVIWLVKVTISCDARRQARSHRGPADGSLRNSLGTTARGKLEAGDGYTAHPQDAQRPNRLRSGAGRRRNYAGSSAHHGIRLQHPGTDQAIRCGHRVYLQVDSGNAWRRRCSFGRALEEAAGPGR